VRRRHRHAALDGLKADGFKAIINLRTAGEQGANLEQNAARAKELGLKYISIPFSPQQPDPKAVDDGPWREIANKSNQPGLLVHCGGGEPRGCILAGESACWQDGLGPSEGDRGSEVHWPAREPLEKFRARLHRDAHKK
jgi:protein tyrosine phosphatase (PTP) superfamily phosphohydrolase (DUF442 family)